MGKRIVKSDLTNSNITSMAIALQNDINDTQKIISSIDSFISEIESSENLSGESYKKVKDKLNKYKEMLSKRATIAESLKTAISSALKTMSNYMEDYDILDTSELEELNTRLENARANINSIQASLEELNLASNSTDEEKRELNNQLINTNYLVTAISKEIEKLKNLDSTDASAYASIESIHSSIQGYNSTITALQETTISSL